MTTTYRQGDVLLVAIDTIPGGQPVARDRGHLVLAYGEVTGHAHVIDAPPETAVLTAAEHGRFLRLLADANLVHGVLGTTLVRLPHDEHAPVAVPAGSYAVLGQEEWTDAMEPRAVLD